MKRFENVDEFNSVKQKYDQQVDDVGGNQESGNIQSPFDQRQHNAGAEDVAETYARQDAKASHYNRDQEVDVPGRDSQIDV